MAADASFDIVSQVDVQEVSNAVQQAMKEISQRFDFKGSASDISLDRGAEKIVLVSDNEGKLDSVKEILNQKLIRRNVSTKALDYGTVEKASGNTVRQEASLVQGISQDVAKKITKMIKDTKLKVQAEIQKDQVRVKGKKKDELQQIIQMLRDAELGIELQFINFR